MNLDLGKYPLIITSGEPVLLVQAKNIIKRTDITISSYHTITRGLKYRSKNLQHLLYPNNTLTDDISSTKYPAGYPSGYFYGMEKTYRTLLQSLSIQYLTNDCILPHSFDGITSGWCKTNGDLNNTFNCGSKWPTSKELIVEAEIIAEAFPYLNMNLCILNTNDESINPNLGTIDILEYYENKNIIMFLSIINGEVRQQTLNTALESFNTRIYNTITNLKNNIEERFVTREHEPNIGVPWKWLVDYSKEIQTIIEIVEKDIQNN